jgi:hypothetical protein
LVEVVTEQIAARVPPTLLDEPELHLDTAIVVPDIAGWRRERLPELPATAFLLPPRR